MKKCISTIIWILLVFTFYSFAITGVIGICSDNLDEKNCSVELIGCASNPCLNGGDCKPYLVNDTKDLFNCSCQHGFQGSVCEKVTTMSLIASSLITVNSLHEEDYDMSLEFKTTLPNGILAFGQGGANSYILELFNGQLNFHSSLLINKWDGLFVGSDLNDSNWQNVYISINSSHVIFGSNLDEVTYPIDPYESTNASQIAFTTTYLGGIIPNLTSYLRHLTHQPSIFLGCMQDVVINGKWILPNESINETSFTNIENNCPTSEH